MDTTHTPSSRQGAASVVERTDPAAHQRHGDMSHIPGWGADLDRKNRPAVPMERTPPRLEHVHPHGPEQQPASVEILHSTERPGITPLFGTSTPPSGLSGSLRRLAYRWSENDVRRWMTLLLADRVNVAEGLMDDLAHGHIPNIPAEMGARAEWRHNRAGFVRKAMAVSAVVGVGLYLMQRRSHRDGR